MDRRNYVVAAIVALCSAVPALSAENVSDRICTRDLAAARGAVRTQIAEAFEQKPAVVSDELTAAMGPLETVVARIGPDGKPVLGCYDNPEAVERFFKAAIERLQKTEAKEQ